MKILLSGYYGFDNAGDEAILSALVTEIKALGHEPIALSSDPEKTARAHNVKAVSRTNPLALLRAISSCNVMFSGGGGLLQDKTSSRTLTYYLGLIGIALALRKRVVIFNQSIGPLSEEGQKKVAKALQKTRNIVRDRGSLALLEGLGVRAELGGDPALLLKISSNYSVSKPQGRDENTVILAPRGGQRPATFKLAEVAHALESEGKKIVLLAFQKEEDSSECKIIAAACSKAEIVAVKDPQDALNHISRAGLVIGVRLHAVILAAAVRVPFLGISYDPKVQGFCEDAGAFSTGTDFDVNDLISRGLRMDSPDWKRVAEMKERAKRSFLRALE
jgi:polysaccharide pyruvyl transferase CsaB